MYKYIMRQLDFSGLFGNLASNNHLLIQTYLILTILLYVNCYGGEQQAVYEKYEKTIFVNKVEWHYEQFSECSVTCGSGMEVSRAFCRDATEKFRVKDSFCMQDGVSKPSPKARACIRADCQPQWVTGRWGGCSKPCGGGVELRHVDCMEQKRDGSLVKTLDQLCSSLERPARNRSCNLEICPQWRPGQWSPCSMTCGTGVQVRAVLCMRVSLLHDCPASDRPADKQFCFNSLPCSEDNVDDMKSRDGNKIPATSSDSSEVAAGTANLDLERVVFPYEEVNSRGRYNGDNSSLDQGRGSVTAELSGVRVVEKILTTSLPTSSKPSARWRSIPYGRCSVTCGDGVRMQYVQCVSHSSEGLILPASPESCPPESRPSGVVACSEKFCPPVWNIGPWSQCSAPCGSSSMQKRQVRCMRRISNIKLMTVDRKLCLDQNIPEPSDERTCINESPCANPSSTPSIHPMHTESGASPDKMPLPTEENLSFHATKTPGLIISNQNERANQNSLSENVLFMQLLPLSPVVVKANGRIVVITGSDVTLICPIISIDNAQHIERRILSQHINSRELGIAWKRNGQYLKSSFNPKLESSASRMFNISNVQQSDSGVYECFGRIENSEYSGKILIETHSKEDAKKKLAIRKHLAENAQHNQRQDGRPIMTSSFERKNNYGGIAHERNKSINKNQNNKYLDSELVENTIDATGGELDDIYKNDNSEGQYVKWEWSNCSEVCRNTSQVNKKVKDFDQASGHQTRQVTCEKMKGHFTVLLDDDFCGGQIPKKSRSCRAERDCPVWKAESWSQCTQNCKGSGTTKIENLKQGSRTRRVKCIWPDNGKDSDPNICMLQSSKPHEEEACFITVSTCGNTSGCEDKSKFCSLVGSMRLCHYPQYRSRCCQTCGRSQGNTLRKLY